MNQEYKQRIKQNRKYNRFDHIFFSLNSFSLQGFPRTSEYSEVNSVTSRGMSSLSSTPPPPPVTFPLHHITTQAESWHATFDRLWVRWLGGGGILIRMNHHSWSLSEFIVDGSVYSSLSDLIDMMEHITHHFQNSSLMGFLTHHFHNLVFISLHLWSSGITTPMTHNILTFNTHYPLEFKTHHSWNSSLAKLNVHHENWITQS